MRSYIKFNIGNNMKKILIVFLTLFFSTTSYADISYGITASITQIDADGSETEGGEKTTASADNTVLIPSIFVEKSLGAITVGLDYIPMDADVSNKTKSRNDTETSVSGTAATTTTARTNKAQAELANHITLYANYDLTDTMYLKAGIASVELNTLEDLGTGSKYGNEDIYGGVFGVGMRSDGGLRIEAVYTDYEDVSITSSTARSGVTANNKIEADLDTFAIRVAYSF